MEDYTQLWSFTKDDFFLQNIESAVSQIIEPKYIDNNKVNINFLEKLIYDISKYHANYKDNIFIEFYYDNKINNKLRRHNKNTIKCSSCEKIYTKPSFTCIIFLDEKPKDIALIHINNDDYLYKNFDDMKYINIICPKYLEYIVINKDIFYGCPNEVSNKLIINVYEEMPKELYYYNDNNYEANYNTSSPYYYTLINTYPTVNIDVNKRIMDFKFFEDLLYGTESVNILGIFEQKKNYSECIYKYSIDIIDKTKLENEEKIKKKYGKIYDEILDISNGKISYNNRFLQRCFIKNIFLKNTCKWLCDEIEKNRFICENNNILWRNLNYKNSSVDYYSLDKCPHLFQYFLTSFDDIIQILRKFYNLDMEIKINITDISIIKYNYNISKEYSSSQKNTSCLNLRILLSDNEEFEGGELNFYDNLSLHMCQGDLLIHSGQLEHYMNPLQKGIKFELLAIIDFILE
jgi:hypothetical protein